MAEKEKREVLEPELVTMIAGLRHSQVVQAVRRLLDYIDASPPVAVQEERDAALKRAIEALTLISMGAPLEQPERYEGDNHGDTMGWAMDSMHYSLAKIARHALAAMKGDQP